MFDVDIFSNDIIKLPYRSLVVLESNACILLLVRVQKTSRQPLSGHLFASCGAQKLPSRRLRTVLELMLNKDYYISCCKKRPDKVSMESGFSPSGCLTIYSSSVTSGKNFSFLSKHVSRLPSASIQ